MKQRPVESAVGRKTLTTVEMPSPDGHQTTFTSAVTLRSFVPNPAWHPSALLPS